MISALTQLSQAISHWAREYYKEFELVAEESGAFDDEVGQETRAIMRKLFRV